MAVAVAGAPCVNQQVLSFPLSSPSISSPSHRLLLPSPHFSHTVTCSLQPNHGQHQQQEHLHRQNQQFARIHNFVASAYASGVSQYQSDPIDVDAKVQTEKIVVLGGSGFVGSAICKAAISQGIEVVSLSRSGRPPSGDAWVDQVMWIAGDVFYADWDGLLNGVTAVISTLGGFGTNEQMEKLNGESNVLAVNAALNAGVRRWVYVSVHDYNFPDLLKGNGYFGGKKRAEAEVLAKFPTTGTVLRPGFIYGKRRVNGFDVPLDLVGEPFERILAAAQPLTRPLSSLPASDFFLASPVSVDDVAYAAIKAVTDDSVFGIQTIEQIKELASTLRAP